MNRRHHGNRRKVAWVLVAILWGTTLLAVISTEAAAERGTISVQRESGPREGSFFNMELRDADLKDVLRALGQESGQNVIIGDGIEGRLTLSFQRVTVQEAFDAILKINNLISFQDRKILRIVKSPFTEGEGDLITRIIPVNFAGAREIADSIKNMLSEQGSVAVDTRTNSLIVRDLPDNLARVGDIIKSLDSRTPQIMIEARIVEASTNFTRELGIQWGGNFTNQTGRGTYQVTGAVTDPGGTGASLPLTGGAGLSGNNFMVNLPATVAGGTGGAVGFTFGNVASTRQLDIQLSAMEDSGQGRILSNPRVLTLDNKEARISSGTEIFVQTSILSGAATTGVGGTGTTGSTGSTGAGGVTKIDAKLELTVTPHVTPDGYVVMHIRVDKKEPDFNRQVQNIPPLTTRSAETDLRVKNGETVVIGGIYARNESVSERGIPWLSKIPILGWLFKKEVRVDNQAEMLIFITPTIYEGE